MSLDRIPKAIPMADVWRMLIGLNLDRDDFYRMQVTHHEITVSLYARDQKGHRYFTADGQIALNEISVRVVNDGGWDWDSHMQKDV